MKLLKKHSLALMGIVFLVAAVPSNSHAKGSVHLDVPGFSIGWHDNNRNYRNNHYKSGRRHYNHNSYDRKHYDRKRYDRRYNDYYRDDYRNRKHHNRNNNHYDNNRYYDDYYSGGQRNNSRNSYYDRPNVVAICPIGGYARYRDRNRSCYQHKGHYHCE
ncbi:MAG: hypothetical protein ACI9FR_003052 [Cryomorphaceae bacterium]|jgi:hypothetical protein